MNNEIFDDMLIMVIDDQATMRKIISQLLLQIARFKIIEAENEITEVFESDIKLDYCVTPKQTYYF